MGEPDRQAVRTLLGTYWSSAGWRDPPATEPDDLARAVEAGVMFGEPVTFDHDALVGAVLQARAAVSHEAVVAAFLTSLATRRLDHRSALGSFSLARHLPEHGFEAGRDPRCALCGAMEEEEIDRDVLNFERFKWSGVRHANLSYVWHDLDRFAAADHPEANDDDRAALAAVLDELEGAPAGTSAPKAAKSSLRSIKGNEDERGVLLDILGLCSVLETPEHLGYADDFVRADSRPVPPLRFVEREYPVCWWKAEHGVNRSAAKSFGLL